MSHDAVVLAWLLVSVVHPHACGHGTERSQSPQVCKFWLSVLPLPHTLAEHSTCHMLHAMLLLVCAWPCVVRSCVLLRRYAVFSVGVSGAARHRNFLLRGQMHDKTNSATGHRHRSAEMHYTLYTRPQPRPQSSRGHVLKHCRRRGLKIALGRGAAPMALWESNVDC